MQKYCRKCEEITERSPKTKRCLICRRKQSKQWRVVNPDYQHAWRKNNPEYSKEYTRNWAKNNPQYFKEHCRSWAENNPESKRYTSQQQRLKHPKKIRARQAVNNAVTSKEIPHVLTQSCEDCEDQAQNYHHNDYGKPLEITALCTTCHGLRHRIY